VRRWSATCIHGTAMKLPRAELGTVPEEKVTRYLLNAAHSAGGGKASFFLRFGFSVADWRRLKRCASTRERMKWLRWKKRGMANDTSWTARCPPQTAQA
jgi:hypothetical protein